jgi:hypothetical protein
MIFAADRRRRLLPGCDHLCLQSRAVEGSLARRGRKPGSSPAHRSAQRHPSVRGQCRPRDGGHLQQPGIASGVPGAAGAWRRSASGRSPPPPKPAAGRSPPASRPPVALQRPLRAVRSCATENSHLPCSARAPDTQRWSRSSPDDPAGEHGGATIASFLACSFSSLSPSNRSKPRPPACLLSDIGRPAKVVG